MDYSSIIAILAIFLTGAGSTIAIYVKFNNDMALAKFRISTLEKQCEHLSNKVEQQDGNIAKLLGELKDDIHGLRLLIEQNKS